MRQRMDDATPLCYRRYAKREPVLLPCLLRTGDSTKLQFHMDAGGSHQEYIDEIAINVPLTGSPVRRSEKCQTRNRV